MALLELDENKATFQIKAYKPGTIQINDAFFTRSLIVSATQLIDNWTPQAVADLKLADFDTIKQLRPDILLIGTGSDLIFLAPEIYGELINHGIGVEIMNTSAARRTFNALTAESRNVVAALLL